jgi:hypothetical protein
MAIGDAAAAAGMDLVSPTGSVNAGYTEINKSRDYVANERTRALAAEATKLPTTKLTVQPAATARPATANVGDVLIRYP